MEIGVGFDALNNSNKRVKRSSTGNGSVESSAGEDDLVEAIDASAQDLGIWPWKPMNRLRCKPSKAAKGISKNRISQPESSRSTSYSLEKGNSIVGQKRAGNESGKRAALFGKEMVNIAEEQGSSESYQNLGLQKAQDFKINMNQLSHTNSRINKEKLSSSYLPERMHETDIEDKGNANVIGKCPRITTQGHISNPHAKGKRKCNFGETSVSILNQASHAARARQIESDEIFARELQEQFFHETTGAICMDTGDATIERSLQQDEEWYAPTPPQMGASKSALIHELNWKLEYEADLEKRLELYEALEDLLENSDMLEDDDLASNHSYYNICYAMGPYIDESKHQHVASSVIDSLPLALIEDNNDKEACAVCLEIPSVGETMRYLPCLHKFHKTCIDTWLKIKPACPVCKFSMNLS